MKETTLPGAVLRFDDSGGMFAKFKPLIDATDGLTLGQVCAVTGLEPSTIQNWIKRGYVAHPVKKKYRERQLARILLIASLRDCMKIESIGLLMRFINGNADDESDDIIREEQLYDYFCAVVAGAGDNIPSLDGAAPIVERAIAGYTSPKEGAKERLADALCVMAYAYAASRYKQKAEQMLDSLINC